MFASEVAPVLTSCLISPHRCLAGLKQTYTPSQLDRQIVLLFPLCDASTNPGAKRRHGRAFVLNADSKKQAFAAASASATTINNHRIRVNLEASFVTLVTFC